MWKDMMVLNAQVIVSMSAFGLNFCRKMPTSNLFMSLICLSCIKCTMIMKCYTLISIIYLIINENPPTNGLIHVKQNKSNYSFLSIGETQRAAFLLNRVSYTIQYTCTCNHMKIEKQEKKRRSQLPTFQIVFHISESILSF
jgi:hypothetical protein